VFGSDDGGYHIEDTEGFLFGGGRRINSAFDKDLIQRSTGNYCSLGQGMISCLVLDNKIAGKDNYVDVRW